MSSDIAISVKNLTKTYRLFDHPGDRIKQALTFGRVKFHKEFTALKDVSFEIRKGETVGIIGKNGSGKSTLLQLICGILKPTSGSVTVNGRISALLELGSGFNPEFTGRENIYFQGAIMGFARAEMDARVDDIIAFADIGEFIDQPVRTYSSGMFVRLAFATAIHSDPDILVIDEALAVGDMEFQKKSFAYMSRMISQKKTTVILVSHDLRQVQRFCYQAIYIENGRCKQKGDPYKACQSYYEAASSQAYKANDRFEPESKINATDEVELLEVQLFDGNGNESRDFYSGNLIGVRVRFHVKSHLESPELIIGTQTSDFNYLSSSSTVEYGNLNDLLPGEHTAECVVATFPLAVGNYFVRFVIRDKSSRLVLTGEALTSFQILAGKNDTLKPKSLLNLPAKWTLNGIQI